MNVGPMLRVEGDRSKRFQYRVNIRSKIFPEIHCQELGINSSLAMCTRADATNIEVFNTFQQFENNLGNFEAFNIFNTEMLNDLFKCAKHLVQQNVERMLKQFFDPVGFKSTTSGFLSPMLDSLSYEATWEKE